MLARVAALASVLISSAHADPALAPPGMQPAAAAPANGPLVKSLDIATNPVAPLFGYFEGSLAVAVSSTVALRFDLNKWIVYGDGGTGYQIGLSAPVYFRRTFSGPFVEPGVVMRGPAALPSLPAGEGPDREPGQAYGVELLAGWHWMADSGLNLAVAIGAKWFDQHVSFANEPIADEPEVTGYTSLGYAF